MRGTTIARWVIVCVVLMAVAGVFVMRSRNNPARRAAAAAAERAAQKMAATKLNVTRVEPDAVRAQQKRATQRARLVITGRVTLPDSRPAANATASATRFESTDVRELQMRSLVNRAVATRASAVVSADGKYRIETQEPFMHRLEVRLAGYATATAALDRSEPPPSAETRTITRDLSLVPSSAMRGRVVDDAGQPISGASVAAMPEGRMWRGEGLTAAAAEITSSSTAGDFAFDCFTSSGVVFSAWADGFVPFTGVAQLPKENLEIVLRRGGSSVEGVVRMKTTGEPVADARVVASPDTHDFERMAIAPPAEALSRGDGTFRIANLGAGSYRLLGAKDKLQTYISAGGTRGRLRLAENEAAKDREVLLYQGHTVTGRVTEQGSKKGLPEVKVSQVQFMPSGDSLSTMTAADGSYRLEGVSPMDGDFLALQATRRGYVVAGGDRRGPPGTFVRVQSDDLELRCDIAMTSGVAVSGTVKFVNGSPAANATVSAGDNPMGRADEPVTADVSGAFEVIVPPFRHAVLQAKLAGFPSARSEQVEVRDTPVTGTEIVMGPGASLQGKVVDEEGNPVGQAAVSASLSEGRRRWMAFGPMNDDSTQRALSDVDGMFQFLSLPQGTISLSASKDGYRPSNDVEIALEHGESTSGLQLTLRDEYFISGRVTDKAGKPLSGAQVSARPPDERRRGGPGGRGGGPGGWRGMSRVETGPDGTYRLDNLSSGTYTVSAELADYKDQRKENVATNRSDVDFALESVGRTTFIGKVVDSRTNQTVADFEVSELRGRSATKQGAPGQFTVANVPRGTELLFEIAAPKYATLRSRPIAIDSDMPTQEYTFQLEAESLVKGRVVDSKTHGGVAGVKISFQSAEDGGRFGGPGGRGGPGGWRERNTVPSVTSGADGRFEATGVPSGAWTLNFEPPADAPYSAVTRQIVAETAGTVDLGDVELGAGSILRGIVVRVPANKGVSGVQVSLGADRDESRQSAVTDSAGKFVFEGLRNGSYSVRVREHDIRANVNLQPNETRDITLRLGMATLKGMVVYDGKPARAELQFLKTDTSDRQEMNIETGEDGLYTMSNLAAGKWEITARARMDRGRSASAKETVEMPEEGAIEKNIILPSSRVFGQVVDAGGNPVTGATVTASAVQQQPDAFTNLTPDSGEGNSAATGNDGSFSIGRLAGGVYIVQATHSESGRAQVDGVSVPAGGETGPLTITLANTGNCTLVSVALNMSTGGPLRNAWCMLWRNGVEVKHSARRDNAGVMRITGLDPGMYTVQVSAYGFSVSEQQVQLQPGQEARIDDVLYESGSLRVHVWDAGGKAVPGAACMLQPVDPNAIEKPRQGVADQNGLWVARGLQPTQYNASASLPGGKTARGSIIVPPRQAVDLDLRPAQ